MFPLTNKEPYIMSTGERTTLGDILTKDDAAINQLKEALTDLTNYDANNGVKNIWNINAIGIESQSGITYTPSEGVLKLTGTALNASVWPTTVTSAEKSYILKPNTTYKISVGVTFSNSIKLGIYVKATESSEWDNVLTADSGTEATYTTPATWAQIWIRVEIASGYTFPATLYPMIRDASITDPTYQPYAKTNSELTADVAGLNNIKSFAGTSDFTFFTNLCAALNAELLNAGDSSMGVVTWTGVNRYLYHATRIATNAIRVMACKTNTLYTMTYENSTLYLYSYEGTQISS